MDQKSVAQKMYIKPKMNGIILNKPEGVSTDLFGFESSVQLDAQPDSPLSFIIMFAKSTVAELERNAKQAVNLMGNNTMLWVAYPKKSGSISSELDRDSSVEALDNHGLQGVSQIALNADWSLIRFKYRSDTEMLTYKF